MTVVAIDGPAGAGKSTVARAVADRLGFRYVDTGAMYRALALLALEAGADPEDGPALAELLDGHRLDAGRHEVWIDDREVGARVRDPDVTALVSRVSRHPEVRSLLALRQRELASATDVVMEGRDIGSTVVPTAEVKVFLTASLEERARRRWLERPDAGAGLADVQAAIAARDAADEGRSESPLVQAPGASVVDTTGRSIEEVVSEVVRLVTGRSEPRDA
ncbi:MAG TPA: (d)CMP kinase [Actinomycetota bacterium]|nr:(d)CMP kinase [Actinomycetota bacterium]